MASVGFPESWDNYFLLSITRRGSSAQSEIQFAAIVDPTSLTINRGEKPVESVPNAASGRIWKQDPQADGEISFDILPIELDTASGVGLFQQYVGVSGNTDPNAYATSEPLATDTAWPAGIIRNADRFRIAVLRTNDPATTTAAGATAAATHGTQYCQRNRAALSSRPWAFVADILGTSAG